MRATQSAYCAQRTDPNMLLARYAHDFFGEVLIHNDRWAEIYGGKTLGNNRSRRMRMVVTHIDTPQKCSGKK